MTRRTLLVLVTLLVSVFTFLPTHPVGACELDANDRCVRKDPAEEAAMFRAVIAPESPGGADSSATVSPQLCTKPTIGFPTCYAPQDDGTWAREEMADVESGWVAVDAETYDEMQAAVGDVNASVLEGA
jgi:hypothetical protein